MRNNRYGALAAWVYDLDKPVGRSFGDVEFYRDALHDCAGPILEPAVGNGRVLIPLLQAGYDVEGFDASEEMLAHCRRQCQARGLRPRLSIQRFEDFACDRAFAAVIVPAGSIQLLTDPRAALEVLRRFHDHLRPGGRLIIDLDPVGAFFGPETSVRRWDAGPGEALTLTERRIEVDHVAQTTVTRLVYEHWRGGVVVDRATELFSLRWWGVVEFELALRAAGFGDIVVSANYRRGGLPDRTTQALTFEAVRPAA